MWRVERTVGGWMAGWGVGGGEMFCCVFQPFDIFSTPSPPSNACANINNSLTGKWGGDNGWQGEKRGVARKDSGHF